MRKSIFFALLLVPLAANAGIIAAERTLTGLPNGAVYFQDFTQGWAFTPTQDIIVDALGVFDVSGDGLAATHTVNLWTSVGVSLANTTISAGVHTLTGGNVFNAIAGVALTAGQTYVVSTFIQGASENFLDDRNSTLSFDSIIGMNPDLRYWINAGAFPTNTVGCPTCSPLGANFTFAVRVPEPGTLALLGAGLIGLAWRRRRD